MTAARCPIRLPDAGQPLFWPTRAQRSATHTEGEVYVDLQ